MAYPTNFEFNGVNLNSIGYTIVSFDGATTGEQDYEDALSYNISKAANNPQTQIHGFHTESTKKFDFEIGKINCSKNNKIEEIVPREQAFLKRWLERADGYKYFRFLDGENDDIYYYCTIQIKWYKIASTIYGAHLYITCDSTNAYSDIQSFEIQNFQNGDTIQIFNNSDVIGSLELTEIEIEPLEDGRIYLTNNMDSLYYYNSAGMLIENCVKNENITINGLMNEIATNDFYHSSTLMDDYNWNPLHLINLDDSAGNYHNDNLFTDNRINIIQNQGVACNLSFAYRTIRSGVI